MTTRSTPGTGKRKKCGAAACGKVAAHVAISGFMHVFLCESCVTKSPPKGNWKIRQLTSPGAETYLEAP